MVGLAAKGSGGSVYGSRSKCPVAPHIATAIQAVTTCADAHLLGRGPVGGVFLALESFCGACSWRPAKNSKWG